MMLAAGAWIYEANDMHFSQIGVALVILNLIAAVFERIAQRHLLAVRVVDVSRPSLMILNNTTGVVLVLIVQIIFVPDDAFRLGHSMTRSASTATWVALSCMLGVTLSYFGIWLQVLYLKLLVVFANLAHVFAWLLPP